MKTSKISRGGVVAAFVLIIAVQLVWFMGLEDVVFADGDSYLRLLRVNHLIAGGDWLDVTIADANAPFGFDLHWSRPFDLAMLLVALPIAPIIGWPDAIHHAGIWISPLLHLATAGAMVWSLSPLLGRVGACVAAGLSATQIGFLSFAVVGRADHHMVFPVIVVLMIGYLIRAFDAGDRANATRAGAAVAVGIWIGPEFMLMMAVVVAVCGFGWMMRWPGALAVNRGLSIGLSVGLVIALLVERGGQVLTVEYDRLSLFHITCGGMILMFWAVIEGVSERHPNLSIARRIGLAVLGVALMGGVVVSVFPAALGYPFAEVDPAFLRIQSAISDYVAVTSPRAILLYLGGAIIAVPWVVFRVSQREQRWAWFLIATLLLVYTGITLGWLRWSLYAALLASLVLADLLVAFDQWVNHRSQSPLRVFLKVPLIVLIILGPSGVAIAMTEADEAAPVVCPVDRLSDWLAATYDDGKPKTILAAANFGPEILYRTRHHVLATLSHRNTDGILDGYRVMISADISAIKAMIDIRGIDLIVVCPDAGAESYIRRDRQPGALYDRLLAGDTPSGFAEVSVPSTIAPFRVFATPLETGHRS